MIYNIIKYTVGLPLLLLLTFSCLVIYFIFTLIEVTFHILSDYTPSSRLNFYTKKFIIETWKPINFKGGR